ncbi:MAG: GNAT family N-acetyltransferase [Planctomycetes bacterium]|nr:GNAT family N-acetyltransferase [Planctomycetota bacterium]
MAITIRPATPADIPLILRFIRELAEYEREPQAVIATESLIHDALFGRAIPCSHIANPLGGPIAECLIGLIDDVPHGFAVYFHNFSTWKGRAGLYLEDLYVTPHSRGKGLGLALLRAVARVAVQRQCPRMEWAVLDWNTPAIDFYEKLGARRLTDWTICRLDGDALARVGSAD